jgi:predicted amidophosphoribosyltransferase
MRKLKERCYSCSKPIDPAWRMCPYCEAETNAPTPSTTRRRRRQTTDQATVAAEPAPELAEATEAAEPSRRRRR